MSEQPNEAEIEIVDGESPLTTRRCRIVRLRDGRSAALWRGLAFPILPGSRINATGDAWAISDTLPLSTHSKAFTVINGQAEAYVLVPGDFFDVEKAAGRLRKAGISVLRTGRYFGESIADVEADWFIRIVNPEGAGDLATALAPILDIEPAKPAEAATTDLRTRLLTAELLAARAREAGLQAEIARLRSKIAEGQPEAERLAAELRQDLEEEQHLRIAAEQAAAALDNRPRPGPSGRIADEMQDVLAGLLPGIRMLRDSVEVITAEFASRRGVWRALGELTTSASMPRDWKKIHGADGWWERHLINGRDNTGRIYVRKSATTWDVLISHKTEQPRDIAWLARQ